MIHVYGNSLSSLSLASSHSGGFPYSVALAHAWQVEVMSGSTDSSRVPQYTCIRSMRSLSRCPSSNYGSIQQYGVVRFMRNEGCSLSFSL